MTHTKAGDEAPFVEYFVGISVTKGDSQYGNYSYNDDKVKIVEKLPAGAIMFGVPNSE